MVKALPFTAQGGGGGIVTPSSLTPTEEGRVAVHLANAANALNPALSDSVVMAKKLAKDAAHARRARQVQLCAYTQHTFATWLPVDIAHFHNFASHTHNTLSQHCFPYTQHTFRTWLPIHITHSLFHTHTHTHTLGERGRCNFAPRAHHTLSQLGFPYT